MTGQLFFALAPKVGLRTNTHAFFRGSDDSIAQLEVGTLGGGMLFYSAVGVTNGVCNCIDVSDAHSLFHRISINACG